jgi:hypothetical protein
MIDFYSVYSNTGWVHSSLGKCEHDANSFAPSCCLDGPLTTNLSVGCLFMLWMSNNHTDFCPHMSSCRKIVKVQRFDVPDLGMLGRQGLRSSIVTGANLSPCSNTNSLSRLYRTYRSEATGKRQKQAQDIRKFSNERTIKNNLFFIQSNPIHEKAQHGTT